jgi:hypothetical protein
MNNVTMTINTNFMENLSGEQYIGMVENMGRTKMDLLLCILAFVKPEEFNRSEEYITANDYIMDQDDVELFCSQYYKGNVDDFMIYIDKFVSDRWNEHYPIN